MTIKQKIRMGTMAGLTALVTGCATTQPKLGDEQSWTPTITERTYDSLGIVADQYLERAGKRVVAFTGVSGFYESERISRNEAWNDALRQAEDYSPVHMRLLLTRYNVEEKDDEYKVKTLLIFSDPFESSEEGDE